MGSWSRKPQRTRLSLAVALSATVAGLAAGILGTPGTARAAAPVPPSFGVQFHATWSDYTDAQRVAVLDKLKAAGVTWIRVDLGWASLQEYGRNSFSKWYVDLADSVVNAARARGLHVLGTLWSTPAWANGGRGTNVPPSDVNDYARIASWAAAHFHGRVEAWEVWNEPNLTDFFTGDAAAYARLLRAAYPAFKRADSKALVVFGGPSANDTAYLARAYSAGVRGSFDVMATHPYQGIADAPPEKPDDGTKYTLSHVRAVRDLMVKQGDSAKPIWFTEFGWSSHANWSGVENWNRGVTPQQQGDYLVRTIRYVKANFPYVTNMFWYNERNLSTGTPQLDNYGLLDRSLSPKPAYLALQAQLTGAKSTAFASSAAARQNGKSRTLEAHHGKRHARVRAPHWVQLRR
jgi:polysaccharide biosynthesis protein PslG